MKKKQEFTTDETLAQIFVSTYKFAYDSTHSFIKFYNDKYKMLTREMYEHEENEPLKFFKKAHKAWEIKKDKLSLELDNTFKNLMDEYKELEDLINLSVNN